jgi:hypothetical protein
MKAFVQIHQDNQYYNPNFFEAWRGFSHLGYEVIPFKIHEVNDIGIKKETPAFASVPMTKQLFRRLGVKWVDLPSYPKELDSYLNRKVYIEKWGKVKKDIELGKTLFIKPLDEHRKHFVGQLVSENELILIDKLPDFQHIFVSEPLKFLVEYRVFIRDGNILDARRYTGDFKKLIDFNVVEQAMRDLKSPPVAYCLDFGLDEFGRTSLVEATDAWSFGHYGLDMLHFINMVISRWNEIVFDKNKS